MNHLAASLVSVSYTHLDVYKRQVRMRDLRLLMRNQQLFDNLQIYDTVLQLMTFLWAADDASNTDIIEELQKQNSKYLETIIRQNKKIISMFETQSSISTSK